MFEIFNVIMIQVYDFVSFVFLSLDEVTGFDFSSINIQFFDSTITLVNLFTVFIYWFLIGLIIYYTIKFVKYLLSLLKIGNRK